MDLEWLSASKSCIAFSVTTYSTVINIQFLSVLQCWLCTSYGRYCINDFTGTHRICILSEANH